ncbi:hypothetical protein OIO90_006246 [Microbotryomycetes sp. JL221]|nr:hypothetical protein OIO90_006246 [Microbotryomycetes sp. JL221]
MTPHYASTERFKRALELFQQAHQQDPAGQSAAYHAELNETVHRLAQDRHRTLASNLAEAKEANPSEALVLAANCQHIRRWERPRSSYGEGLSQYKMWRSALSKFHTEVAHAIMTEAGYDAQHEKAFFSRVRDLLQKRTLARPPLPDPLPGRLMFSQKGEVQHPLSDQPSHLPPTVADPDMHLFEDAICIVFLRLQFVDFARTHQDDADKLIGIVRKTWVKMTLQGHQIVTNELVSQLPKDLQMMLATALGGA